MGDAYKGRFWVEKSSKRFGDYLEFLASLINPVPWYRSSFFSLACNCMPPLHSQLFPFVTERESFELLLFFVGKYVCFFLSLKTHYKRYVTFFFFFFQIYKKILYLHINNNWLLNNICGPHYPILSLLCSYYYFFFIISGVRVSVP